MKLLAAIALFFAVSTQAAPIITQRETIENAARTALMNKFVREDAALKKYPSYAVVKMADFRGYAMRLQVARTVEGAQPTYGVVYVSYDASKVEIEEVNQENNRVYGPFSLCDALKSPLKEACQSGVGDSIKCSDYPGDIEIMCAFDNMNPKNGRPYRDPIQREEHPEAP